MKVTIDGKSIRTAKRVSWDMKDAVHFRSARIIGRVRIELEDGVVVHAPLFASTKDRNLGARFVLLFDTASALFIEVPFEDMLEVGAVF